MLNRSIVCLTLVVIVSSCRYAVCAEDSNDSAIANSIPAAKIAPGVAVDLCSKGYMRGVHDLSHEALFAVTGLLRKLPQTGWSEGMKLYELLFQYHSVQHKHQVGFVPLEKEKMVTFVSFDEYCALSRNQGEVARVGYLAFVMPQIWATFDVVQRLSTLISDDQEGAFVGYATSAKNFLCNLLLPVCERGHFDVEGAYPLVCSEAAEVRQLCSQIVNACYSAVYGNVPEVCSEMECAIKRCSSGMLALVENFQTLVKRIVQAHSHFLFQDRKRFAFINDLISLSDEFCADFSHEVKISNRVVKACSVGTIVEEIEPRSDIRTSLENLKQLRGLGDTLYPVEKSCIEEKFLSLMEHNTFSLAALLNVLVSLPFVSDLDGMHRQLTELAQRCKESR